MRLIGLLALLLLPLGAVAQIQIGGNIYGGGNQGNVDGSTKVTVKSGDLNKVFGGARMANVGGNAYVNIDGKNATGYMVMNYVFGGNDIAGTIGTAKAVGESVPTEVAGNHDGVDDTWNTFVHISAKTETDAVYYTQEECNTYNAAHGYTAGDPAFLTTSNIKTHATIASDNKKVYVGQLFGGGNGDYYYQPEGGKYNIYLSEESFEKGDLPIATKNTDFNVPELDKTYVDVQGGSIVYAYGGGNKATVTEKTVIHVDNHSDVVNHILVDDDGKEPVDPAVYTTYENNLENGKTGDEALPTGYTELLTSDRFRYDMGINTGFSFPSSGEFQIGRFFGGNNLAEMSIRPTWNLQYGKIRNLYSGGNRGAMTSPEGLLLEIPYYSQIVVDNVYGGCRMSDVVPTVNGVYTPTKNLPGYGFPPGLSARVLVRGGDINNVYGGNDVTGTVYGGNAIGIYTTIRGDVYGGGNGAYPYTDVQTYENDDIYGDFYYNPTGNSIVDLNAFRPNAEQVSIRLKGKSASEPTIIQGSVYVGGNCATIETKKPNPLVELKIGSHVIADKVFLGNNGEKMIHPTILEHYADDGFSNLNLKEASQFSSYMEGVAMELLPDIVFDKTSIGDPDDYVDYTSKIGSFYCGGNVGSMAIPGLNSYEFDRGLIIFNKLVAGCNNANVPAGLHNAAYEGGVLGSADERDNYTEGGHIKDRIELNLSNLTVVPMRWNDTFEQITSSDPDLVDGKLKAGETYYTSNLRESAFIADGTEVPDNSAHTYFKMTTVGTQLEWNTAKWNTTENEFVSIGTDNTADDANRRLLGGNIYGGCYESGHVNGNVVININQDIIKRNEVFADVKEDDSYAMDPNGNRNSGVILDEQGDDVMSLAMSVFGAGCGEDTEIWGSTTVNHTNGYVFQIFGGGEEGVVGKKTTITDEDDNVTEEYVYNPAYSSTVNLKGPNPGYSETETGLPLAETEYIYGGGNEGDVIGDCYVYLGDGRVYDAFGGASNADIYGSTELYVGYDGGFPWIRDNVYGGNDFGGVVRGKKNRSSVTTRSIFDPSLLESSTYVKYLQGRVDSIFGGSYGSYDYKDRMYKDYTDEHGDPIDGFSFPHIESNSFVHFQPTDNARNKVAIIFGGSEGWPGDNDMNNCMQEESYVLIDDTNTRVEDRYAHVDIYGGGAYAGVGHHKEPGDAHDALGAGRTVVDLYAGSFNDVYGASNQEGLVGYARVNVPAESTVKVNSLFGGGKGYDADKIEADATLAARYCDTYVTCVDYQGANAIVNDGIYGGNKNIRIACDTYINVGAPVMQSNGYQATVYGAGYGKKTVSGRTNVFMNDKSNAYKVFGGGRDGNAFNFPSLRQWLGRQFLSAGVAVADVEAKVTEYGDILRTFGTYLSKHALNLPKTIGTYPNAAGLYDGTYTNDILPTLTKPVPDYHQTNVHIMQGGNVSGYAYGGGLGTDACVAGTTYIELKGGNVDRDIYGGGQGGPVEDEFDLAKDGDATNDFVATTNVYIEGGMARNVYGGGYLGHVGKHTKVVSNEEVEAELYESFADDILGEANVVIGKTGGNFLTGDPAIQRNAYGGGEGGSVYGTANLTIHNGHIGYRCDNIGTDKNPNYKYTEVLTDVKPNDFTLGGNVFGGGYVVNSYVDIANVNMYGGLVRGSLYGGGEVGPIGRGTIRYATTAPYNTTGLQNGNARIFKAGQTHVKMFGGQVLRNVFGGGRGKDSWGGDGTMFQDADLVATLDLNCKGYIFGQTEVNILGGEVGSEEGMAYNYGNVFGGGDEGSVYSAYMDGNTLRIGKKAGVRYGTEDIYEGYYYKSDGTTYFEHNVAPEGQTAKMEREFTEDCKVLVEPHCKTTSPMTIGDKSFVAGDYIPTEYLSKLKDRLTDTRWNTIDDYGIIIHNAVFAGGNIAAGSSTMYANERTVFGNATASIHDVYNRDLITIGTGHTGGLYGDGNLTFVDGYRELNITNYGTDYYHIATTLPIEEFKLLPKREQDYYEVKYKVKPESVTDREGTVYTKGSTLPEDEILDLFDGIANMIGDNGKPNPAVWEENGVVSTYAGRIMNTIQRADFCGVFGSRMVMKGARDRVPSQVDYTNYTINRVREVSLNKVDSPAGDTDEDNKLHGNYFGIYSSVNFLGAMTSDVKMTDVRTTNSDLGLYPHLTPASSTETFLDWKSSHITDKTRNNGTCHNHLALASGVSLELTTEKSTGTGIDEKDWGLITGVVELDLINVQPGIGGGFVYAKNQHGTATESGAVNTTLTALNEHAVTQWDYDYAVPDGSRQKWQTSGNFIHSSQTIVDDCYNIGGKYLTADGVPAHYWFISGSVYVYDQYISAYTGSPNAFSRTVELPITITAASHGTMTLMDVQPNLYAYYSSYDATHHQGSKLGDEQKLVINNVTYQLNDPISYWDWSMMSAAEKNLFVEETFVVRDSCKIGTKYYPAGYVMLYDEYLALKNASKATQKVLEVGTDPVPAVQRATVAADGSSMVVTDKDGNDVYAAFDDLFRESNNMSHDTGYLLVYNVSNPGVWDKWYTEKEDAAHDSSKAREKKQKDANGTPPGDTYEDGPTYRLKEKDDEGNTITGMLLGQREYGIGDIITKKAHDDYEALGSHKPTTTDQATFEAAYVLTKEYMSASEHFYPGAAVGATKAASLSGYVSPAYVSTSTIQLSETEYIYVNDVMSEAQWTTYKNRFKEGAPEANAQLASDIENLIVPAYYCKTGGLYGGDYYQAGKNYRALAAWSAMSESDRQNFDFNYDALDLLIDPNYGAYLDSENRVRQQSQGRKYQYDGQPYSWSIPSTATEAEKEQIMNEMVYSLPKPIDYTATYNGTSALTYNDASVPTSQEHTIAANAEINREAYESIPNEQRHYAAITVPKSATATTVYVVKNEFVHVETPYAVGATLDATAYGRLTDTEKQSYITTLTFPANSTADQTYYYCREEYKVNEKGEGVTPTAVSITGASGGIETRNNATWVTVGTIINAADDGDKKGYASLPNKQKNFTIHGISPMETSTLYVSRNSDINDLSTEKIITVIYKYDYEESDADGMHITPVSERHVVNIHVTFKSGVPTVADIREPSIVLPGTSITMGVPTVTPGAYEILGGGWELFEKESDAESHINGVEYRPMTDSLYWYQDGFYLAYYAKTYLGKTYSNAVPVSVANYHDLKSVMHDKKHHLHVDYDRTRLKRDSKIYINDYTSSSQNGLDLFKDFYDLSLLHTGDPSDGHAVTTNGDGIITTDGKFKDHHLLNNSTDIGTNIHDQKSYTKGVKAGTNLDFFLRTDIDHTRTVTSTIPNPDYDENDNPDVPENITVTSIEPAPWTSIGSGTDPCFNGTLHGDGHTLSGLSSSLFGKLCGNVYNLGVTGTFTTAGVADTGGGYVESCWVNTTATSGFATGDNAVYAVFGNPTAGSGIKQMVNCYYQDTKKTTTEFNGYKTVESNSHGIATPMPDKAFYNGEVAYDLNNFYLYKRYCDKMVSSGAVNQTYQYYVIGDDDKSALQTSKYYASHPELCSTGYNGIKYVEERFADGDFIYAGGTIPTVDDERHHVESVTDNEGKITLVSNYYPIWPDDYIYFGQKLTYGYSTEAHQSVPTAVVRDGGRIAMNTQGNRVYRAPAYYRSSTMHAAHFNPHVYLAQKENPETVTEGTPREAYPGMTAIDFAGHNASNEVNGTYALGAHTVSSGSAAGTTQFYPPLLDDDGLQSIVNQDETANLLVYAPAASADNGYANQKTYDVLNDYFDDPDYSDYYDNSKGYRIVGKNKDAVYGHLVQSDLKATDDHLLVDKQDFNCPIAYTFASTRRMWYQRTPDDEQYVNYSLGNTTGWQGISLPFSAELVSTHEKGEITHFYAGSETSKNGTGSKIGHEYWLRNLTGIAQDAQNNNVIKANFTYPDATGITYKRATNTFLWDYYYSHADRKDKNRDNYQEYYKSSRKYDNYPFLTAGTPYILGLPGANYYEFDLSGSFLAQNTSSAIARLEKQVITFASNAGIEIGVSDTETTGASSSNTIGGRIYTFKPSYMNETLAASGEATKNYAMAAEGNAYNQTTAETQVFAFRPYFVTTTTSSGARPATRSIVFMNDGGDGDMPKDDGDLLKPGTLNIGSGYHKVIVTSALRNVATVRILSTDGITVSTFDVQPGETVETRVNNTGVYIVQTTDGKHIKKIVVR